MVDLCVFAPLAWERAAVCAAPLGWRPAGARRWEATLPGGGTCVVLQTGVGPVRAAKAAVTAPPARAMLVCGCAGALDPSLAPGTLVVADLACDLATSERFPLAALPAHRLGLAARTGTIVTSAVALAAPQAKRAARGTGAVAVDMETAAIARVAAARGVPLAALRVVLDAAADALPPETLVDAESGRVRPAAALRYFLPPRRWPGALRMARCRRSAERTIRAAACALLGPDGPYAAGGGA